MIDGVKTFKHVGSSLTAIYRVSRSLPWMKVCNMANVDTIGLCPSGVSHQEILKQLLPSLQTMEKGHFMHCAAHQSTVKAYHPLIAAIIDSHEKSAVLCTSGHNGQHGCPLCDVSRDNYHKPDFATTLRNKTIQLARQQRIEEAAAAGSTYGNTLALCKELGTHPTHCQLTDLIVDIYSIAWPEMMHRQLEGNCRHDWTLLINVLKKKGKSKHTIR